MTETQQEIMTFPCDFAVKAMGKTAVDLESLVLSLVRLHVPELGGKARSCTLSKNGNYTSVTVGFEAQSRAQLDAVYQSLVDEPRVLYAL